MTEEIDDEKVGYKRPPRRTRFKKGQSGNPRGRRPDYMMTATDAFRRVLSKKVEVQENGERRQMGVIEAIVMQQVKKALKGDRHALEYMFRTLPGLQETLREEDMAAAQPERDYDKLSVAELLALTRKTIAES